jgi:3-hydroxy-9,10-secoandrosta-1,3,5(10)-triene-9,17-dione monooxygenase
MESGLPPATDLTRKADESVALLAEHAGEADRLGRLPEAVTRRLREAGFLSLCVPRRSGGPEARFRTAFEVYAALGRGCGSSAWVAMILSGGCFMAALYGERAREEVWGADPRVTVCSHLTIVGTARPAEGGVVISGRWAPMSGMHQSDWAIVAVSAGEGTEDSDLALLPLSAGTIENTWQVAGMRATGGDTLVYEEVFVPDHRVISRGKMLSGGYSGAFPDEPLYGATVITALTLTVVAPLLGMAEAALASTLEKLGDTAKSPRRADSATVQLAVAEAASLIDTARLRLYRALDDVERGIETQTQLDPPTQARAGMDAGTAARSIREAVNLLLTAVGTAGFAQTNALQRIWRDVEVAVRHATIAPDLAREHYGRTLLGIEP